jgi:hypothetical protein
MKSDAVAVFWDKFVAHARLFVVPASCKLLSWLGRLDVKALDASLAFLEQMDLFGIFVVKTLACNNYPIILVVLVALKRNSNRAFLAYNKRDVIAKAQFNFCWLVVILASSHQPHDYLLAWLEATALNHACRLPQGLADE